MFEKLFQFIWLINYSEAGVHHMQAEHSGGGKCSDLIPVRVNSGWGGSSVHVFCMRAFRQLVAGLF